jgi:AcrR family transcriptional regulator
VLRPFGEENALMTLGGHDERRSVLIGAATQVIREHGLSNATTRRIAECAGAPLPSLHYYFRSKHELYEAVMANLNTKGTERLQRSITAGMGVAEAAATMLRESAMWSLEMYADMLTEVEIYIWAKRTKHLHSVPATTYQRWLNLVAKLCEFARRPDEPDYDFDAIARMVVACIDGLILQDQMLDEQQMARSAKYAANTLSLAIESGQFNLDAPTE